MKRLGHWLFLIGAIWWIPVGGFGQVPPDHPVLPDFDRRFQARPTPAPKPLPEQALAQGEWSRRLVQPRLEWHRLLRSPRLVYDQDGFLTGPLPPEERGRPEDPDRPGRVVRSFLNQHRQLFGYGEEVLDLSRLDRLSETAHNGMKSYVWRQSLRGIDVYDAVLVGHVTRDGALISLATEWVPDLDRAVPARFRQPLNQPIRPQISARQALMTAVALVDEPPDGVVPEEIAPVPEPPDQRRRFRVPPLPDEAVAKLVWLPTSESAVALCWEIELTRRLGGERFRLLIEAETGEALLRRCLTVYLREATYHVYTSDSPAPMTPGLPAPGTNQAPFVSRSLVSVAALSTNASPTGWIHDAVQETVGNNVVAHTDHDANNEPDLPRPESGPDRVFDFPLDVTQPPTASSDAAVVQLFYWCNWMHDTLYELGFDEAAGNFQKDNFGRGGLGHDPIIADAQDGSGVNNANYTPTRDGEPPRIQMYLFDGPEPDRDGSLDADIILHEYTHGLTDRLVGGGIGISGLQASGMGEGWSDFYALALLSEPEDDLDGAYPAGGYATYRYNGLTQNYYFGIRRYPYSTDLSRNPLTYKDIDPGQISPHTGVPRSPLVPHDPKKAVQVHRQGEVWCAILWDLRAALLRKHGFGTGQTLTLRLVTDGLKLAPPNPTFLQARDAILLADRVNTGGENQYEMWGAFAKRGMGVGAQGPFGDTTTGVVESYQLPDPLSVFPAGTLVFSGPLGGVLLPECRALTLTNRSDAPLPWAARLDSPYAFLTGSSGVLPPLGSSLIEVCLTEAALELSAGTFSSALVVSNLNSGFQETRTVQARVSRIASMPFVEGFESAVLAPYWSVSGAGSPRSLIVTNRNPHSGVRHLTMESGFDGLFTLNELTLFLDLEGYTNVTLEFWLRSFQDEPHPPSSDPFTDHGNFDGLALSPDGRQWYPIAGYPPVVGGYGQVRFDLDETLRQLGLSYNEAFRIRFQQYDDEAIPRDGIGLDDIAITGVAPRRFALSVSGIAREGAPPETVTGSVRLPVPATDDVLVTLTSSNPDQLTVPAQVLLLAETTEATFPVTVIDDADLDGAHAVTLYAAAPTFIGAETVVEVLDNESARLTLALPLEALEGAGLLEEAGRVTTDQPAAGDIEIQLSANPTGLIDFPNDLLLPAGETEVTFDIAIRDNNALDGSRTTQLRASVENWADAFQTITILDNERAALFVSVPALLQESKTTIPISGRVTLGGVLPTNLVVRLESSRPELAAVAQSVTIAAGESSASWAIALSDNTSLSGVQFVSITASAPGFNHGSGVIQLLDDEEAPWAYAPEPAHLAREVPLETMLGWRFGSDELVYNGDFETGTLDGWSQAGGLNGSFILNDGTVDPTGPEGTSAPLSGQFSAMSQQIGPGQQMLFQDISLPAFASRIGLNWMHRVRNHADRFETNQSFQVEIRNVASQVLAVAFATRPGDPLLGDWVQGGFDLTPFSGRTIRLAFVEQDDLGFLNVHVDDVQVQAEFSRFTASEIYLGLDPALGPETLRALTTNSTWNPPALMPNTDYYWRIVARRDESSRPGPVWQFRTRGVGGLDHFTFDPIPIAQGLNQPFEVTLTARDDLGRQVEDFFQDVTLTAYRRDALNPVQVLSFIPGSTPNRYRHALAAIFTTFTNVVETNINATDPSLLRSQLTSKDVFLIPEQPLAPSGSLAALGAEWGPVLQEFIVRGGVVVVCSFSHDEHAILAESGLLSTVRISSRVAVDVTVAAEDLLTEGLPPAFEAPTAALYEAPADGQVLLTSDDGLAVAISRDIGNGRAILIGTDYATNRSAMDLLLANATRWPHRDAAEPVAFSPGRSGYFVAGRWTGPVTIHETGVDIRLAARSARNEAGESEAFDVTTTNDLSVAARDDPDPIEIGRELTLTYTVTHAGPDAASDVVVTNPLPAGLRFIEAIASQGDCQFAGGVMSCALGALAPGQSVSVQVRVEPIQAGFLTNRVVAHSGLSDGFPPNNTAETVTRVNFASLAVGNATVTEGDVAGPVVMIPVFLNPPNAQEVRCDYATMDASATEQVDYTPVSGTITFPPNSTNQFIAVPVLADSLNEAAEGFLVNLFNPVRAILIKNQGSCLILDDDPIPEVSIGDVAVLEGQDPGRTNAVFEVQLTRPSGREVSLTYQTAELTAGAGPDFLPVSGTLVFPQASVRETIVVPVFGDDRPETNETFKVVLSNPMGAVLADAEALGTILDDDAVRLDHFEWSEVPSPQYLADVIPVLVVARDSLGNVFTDVQGPVRLEGFQDPREILLGTGGAQWEIPMGTGFHDARTQLLYPAEDLGGPARIKGLSLNVVQPPAQRLVSWTIRMKHTPLSRYDNPVWEDQGWTVVYQRDDLIATEGWRQFDFSQPFEFNGRDHLMIDLSFNNATFSSDGVCEAQETGAPRALHFQTDSGFGDPLLWRGDALPVPDVSSRVPRLRLQTESAVVMIPPDSDPFVNGYWLGFVLIQQTAHGMMLRATDADGHEGVSNPFDVAAIDDLSLSARVRPDPVRFDGDVTYDLVLTNSGPREATGVWLTNQLADSLTFLSASVSQGACTVEDDRTIVCQLGALPAESVASVSILARSRGLGLITNRASVTKLEAESYLDNNFLTTITPSQPPSVLIDDVTITEGHSGTNQADFRVWLSNPTDRPVSISYSITGGTATNANDFVPDQSFVIIPPSETNTVITAWVLGDRQDEVDETFFVNLENATNAVLLAERATGIITDDDDLPALVLRSFSQREGHEGVTPIMIQIGLTEASGKLVRANYASSNGTAIAGVDYTPLSGILVFPPGATNRILFGLIQGDREIEPDETFFLTLTNPINVALDQSVMDATILNDDALPGVLDHFMWAPVGPLREVDLPFGVKVEARDYYDQVATNYAGFVRLSGRSGQLDRNVGLGNESLDWPFSTDFHDARSQFIYLAEELRGAGTIYGLALNITRTPGQLLRRFTIRLLPTSLRQFQLNRWENGPWTVVYQSDLTISTEGRVPFHFPTPFAYDGTNHLLVDFSFDNPYFTTEGFVAATRTNVTRALMFQTDSQYGDPLQWPVNGSPIPAPGNFIPNIEFIFGQETPIQPDSIVQFLKGVWEGDVTMRDLASDLYLLAEDGIGHFGASDLFSVYADLESDTDADGLSDAWEETYFDGLEDPEGAPGADPDGDGANNLAEFRAHTHPRDPASVLILTEVYFDGADAVVAFVAQSGLDYQLERIRHLGQESSWSGVGPVIVGQGVLVRLRDPGALNAGPYFYRVRLLLEP